MTIPFLTRRPCRGSWISIFAFMMRLCCSGGWTDTYPQILPTRPKRKVSRGSSRHIARASELHSESRVRPENAGDGEGQLLRPPI
jgi:hypothetical protein